MTLPLTFTFAALLALLALPLTMHVSARRAIIGMKAKKIDQAAFGDGNDPMLRNAIRAFGNFIEYTPFALIMLALLEYHQADAGLIWGLGVAFVLGRVVHALSMTFIPHFPLPRALAMFTTYAVFLVPAWWFLMQ